MSRRLSHTAAVILAGLALGLGAPACGGGGASKEERAAQQRAQERWQQGVPRWRTQMLHALNGISLMLSNAKSVSRLQSGNQQATAQLGTLERELSDCSASIKRLGLAPGKLADVRRVALATCRSLERGAQLVHEGVADWQIGNGGRQINSANVALGNGQHGIERVRAHLKTALDD